MKIIRKAFTLFFVLTLCLSLFACRESPAVTTAGTNPPENTTASGTQADTVDIETLRTGNWNTCIKGVDWNYFIYAEGGFYYQNNGFLHFFDPNSRIDVTLCQKAGCPHEKGDPRKDWKYCEASINMNAILCYEGGYLYYDKEDHGQHLYRRDPDGTAETYIATLWKDHAGQFHDIQVQNYLLSDGFLYYTISVSGGELDTEGTLVVEELYQALLRMDLATGKEEELLRVTGTNLGLIAAKKDAVLYTTMEYKHISEVPNGQDRLEAMFNTPKHVLLWTEEANTSQEILCKLYREFPGADSFEYGKVTVRSLDTYYTYDLITGEYQLLPLSEGTKLNGQYRLRSDGSAIYDVQTGEDLPNEFVEKCPAEFVKVDFRCVTTSDNGIIMERQYYADDGSQWLQIAKSYTFYVSFDSLADGLQIADATDFEFWPYEE